MRSDREHHQEAPEILLLVLGYLISTRLLHHHAALDEAQRADLTLTVLDGHQAHETEEVQEETAHLSLRKRGTEGAHEIQGHRVHEETAHLILRKEGTEGAHETEDYRVQEEMASLTLMLGQVAGGVHERTEEVLEATEGLAIL